MHTVSVIVPVHYGGEAFLACMEGLKQSTSSPDEIIVVADGETDGVWRLANGERVRLVKNDVARGPSFARNRGAREASGDVLFFVDADVVVAPDAVARVRAAFAQEPDLTALIGSYDDDPGDPGFLSQYRNLLHHHTHQTASRDSSTFWGACGAVRREAFLALGGFDEGYRRPCIEDIELGYRLRSAGLRIALHKDLQVKHLKRWTATSMLKTDLFARAIPWTELLLRYRTFENNLNVDTSGRLSVAAVFLLPLALGAARWHPAGLLLAGGAAAALIGFNLPFYNFLARKRGWSFAARAVPWHWLYYAYGGLGFAVGTARHLLRS